MSERFHAGSFEAGGIPFTVETNEAAFAALVGDRFRDLRVDAGAPDPVVFEVLHQRTPPPANPWAVWRDGEPREMTLADSYVLTYLLWEITRLLFDRSGSRVHLHGAALVRDGRAVVLAGRSHAGKSTLAAWLTHRGWGFLTDEAALIDPETLLVSPFWRPINVRRPGPVENIIERFQPGNRDAEILVPASTIGALAAAAPLLAIAFPRLAPGRPAVLTPMSPASALVEMTQHFPGLIAGGRAGFRRLARLVEGVPAYLLEFHDLDDAEDVLRTTVSESAPRP